MGKIETATQWMINLANDNSHGYDQDNRWGPDYDCSSAVITAWQTAGVPVKSKGADTTRNMYSVFLNCGFSNVTGKVNTSTGSGLVRGDVLLIPGEHTAMYIGNKQMVHARQNEKGGISGGQTGDQTGHEIEISSYDGRAWTYVLRYTQESSGSTGSDYYFTLRDIAYGSQGAPVGLLQEILKARGIYSGALDQSFGDGTRTAVMNYQRSQGLSVDGSCGPATWGSLLALDKSGNSYIAHNCFLNDNNTSVLLAQEVLKARGYYAGALDWNYGNQTYEAVVAYQKASNGVCGTVDGAVGPKTWAYMLRH